MYAWSMQEVRGAGKSKPTSEPATLGDTTLQVDCSAQGNGRHSLSSALHMSLIQLHTALHISLVTI